MKARKAIATTMLALALLAACSSLAPEPTQTPAPSRTSTNVPIETPSAAPTATLTPLPTVTPTIALTNTPTLEVSSAPLTEWRGLPIMPGAYGVEDDGDMLTYHIDNTVSEVDAYYKKELPGFGWSLLSEGISNSENILNIYINADKIMTIAIAKVGGGNDTTVIIVIT